MTTLVDANVLLDLFTANPRWKEWSKENLKAALAAGEVALNPIIYAEVSIAFTHESELDAELRWLGIVRRPLPYAAAFPAGRAYLYYRREGGKRCSPLPDFYIDAHAQVEGLRLLTRDAQRYRTYFPEVELVFPPS
jgi:predicted nucleic acid-binding protein